jgi:hypothetical protein
VLHAAVAQVGSFVDCLVQSLVDLLSTSAAVIEC